MIKKETTEKIKEKNFISAVIYVHNSQDKIGYFLENVVEVLERNFEHSEIICVNDASSDDSVRIIREIGKKAANTSISVLNMSYFHGIESAMNAGVDLSIGDFVFEFDSIAIDYDTDEIMNVYRQSLKGFDIVSASPDKKQKNSSNLFYFLLKKYGYLTYDMRTESFRILSRRAINRISSMNKSVPYRKALYANCGLRTDNMQYSVTDSIITSKADAAEHRYRRELAIDSLILFTDLGYRFARTMSIIMIFAALFGAAYSITIYLAGSPVAGWTTTILFLSFCFFGIFTIFTFIIKYLQILVNLVFKRKNYSFESIEKITR